MSSTDVARHESSSSIRGWGPVPLWLDRYFELINSVIVFGEITTEFYSKKQEETESEVAA